MTANAPRQLILHMSVSLDGFVARRDGVIDWLSSHRTGVDHGDRRSHANLEMIGQLGLIVLGRGAYEEMAPAWSSSDSPLAQLMNSLPKIVFSQSGSEVDWSNTRITDARSSRRSRGSSTSQARTSPRSAAGTSRTA